MRLSDHLPQHGLILVTTDASSFSRDPGWFLDHRFNIFSVSTAAFSASPKQFASGSFLVELRNHSEPGKFASPFMANVGNERRERLVELLCNGEWRARRRDILARSRMKQLGLYLTNGKGLDTRFRLQVSGLQQSRHDTQLDEPNDSHMAHSLQPHPIRAVRNNNDSGRKK